ncbi:hypothetical protein Geob_0979 [Geotalea daltonii FRC-32]|uniref:Uncharacterized protein n=1 Tax=Geotalea daltonii (strain DSM 22248 / JCM 15807 / FRC-32) TaxID=316067 RepID=B9M2G2_GEODF|nr:hypothetical protein Geob_0979 [Geotalea daltonii FRC-32]
MDEKAIRFLKLITIFFTISMMIVVPYKIKSVYDIVTMIIAPTIIFMPLAFIVIKYKLFIMSEADKKYSQIIFIIVMCIMMSVTKKIPDTIKMYLLVISYETICLFLYLITKNRVKNENKL